jgi:hypothetical protein
MKEEIRIELLKLATQLTCATLENNTATSPSKLPSATHVDVTRVFGDCFKTVRQHFESLSVEKTE